MVEKIFEEEVEVKKKKKSKKVKDDTKTEESSKRKLEGDSEEVVLQKKKKKDKTKKLDVESEIPVKKKRPYFRDKGEKKCDEVVGEKDKKSKFTISLPVSNSTTSDLPAFTSSGKGPKIVIAKEKKVDHAKSEEKLSKRRKKHLKKEGSLATESLHESKGMSKALRYLKTWADDKESWKFEKCRQIWLLHNAYDDTKINNDTFPTLLNYMESVKGGMRQGALDLARQMVKKGVKWEELSEEQSEEELKKQLGEKPSEVELKRAAQIVEALS